ncbi:zinc ABC transporter substrate-binding protein [Microcoleus sp. PH2017_30_WIL_O_A]|uniref:metal ABC transporter solute-binding protein, Zn/Mn family n=1 Tax=Microcoleus sp. PH2017_30_WIL_O_A TaxID=2798840 RepID=UPI001DBFE8BD|nr:zinc ABC transporter substrate-binding protein [Microcoleus sp. PH2017_30_WIL_O_A]MCC3588741.1 zinc ABC transporter substrate-binding protein [Microcoleus sp. PH2017_30_WIL_O_A]
MLKNLTEKSSRLCGVAVLAIACGLVGCTSSPQAKNPTPQSPATTQTQATPATNLPKVVATTGVICDITKEIAEKSIDTTCLIEPGEDPHAYQTKPEDRKVIETANLILYGGYNHEPSIIKLIKSSSNSAPKIAVHELAVPKPLMGEHEHGKEKEQEKSHATEEKVPDPHVWHNPKNGIRMVETIRDELIKVSPTNAQLYTTNATKLTDNLAKIDTWIKAQIATIPAQKRKLVTTHDALSYYANAYGLEIAGVLQGVTTEEQPTAARIAELSSEIKTAGVPTIFVETTTNPKLMQTVAREANVKISDKELYSDELGGRGTGADTYEGMLKTNTCAITSGLGGNCTRFAGEVAPTSKP